MDVIRQRLEEVLKNIKDPVTGQPLDVHVVACHLSETKDIHITFFIGDIPVEKRSLFSTFVRDAFGRTLQDAHFHVSYTTERSESASSNPPPEGQNKLKAPFDPSKIGQKKTFISPAAVGKNPSAFSPKQPGVPTPQPILGVKKIIAVASGKGGVGKSTISALLACAFSDLGFKTALLDGDVYGPSQVQLFGCKDSPAFQPPPEGTSGSGDQTHHKLLPVQAGGISLMSFSFFMDLNDPVIWRGPMIMSVLKQFFFDVVWGQQDIMVIDLPPGTGDAPLSMVQCVSVDGALIVTTPQVISVLDAIKGGMMFRKLHTPILGVVENMSGFVCDSCHKEHDIFRNGGGDIAAQKIETEVLQRFPLQSEVCALMDQGYTWQAFRRPEIKQRAIALALNIGKQIGLNGNGDSH